MGEFPQTLGCPGCGQQLARHCPNSKECRWYPCPTRCGLTLLFVRTEIDEKTGQRMNLFRRLNRTPLHGSSSE